MVDDIANGFVQNRPTSQIAWESNIIRMTNSDTGVGWLLPMQSRKSEQKGRTMKKKGGRIAFHS
jgi:hypothetical protein